MKEFLRRLFFSLWLNYGLSSFDEAVVNAPEGEVLSVLFRFKNAAEQSVQRTAQWGGETVTFTGDVYWCYASNGDTGSR